MGMVREFRDFAMRGNVLDMAVGIIIGVAFGAIVKTMVDRVLMPPLGLLMGGVDFADMKVVLREPVSEVVGGDGAVATAAAPEVAIYYGEFINAVISFLIVALSVFLLIKAMNRAMEIAKRKEVEAPPAPSAPSEETLVLREIRDLLRAKQ